MSQSSIVSFASNETLSNLGEGINTENLTIAKFAGSPNQSVRSEIFDHVHTGCRGVNSIRFNKKRNLLGMFKDKNLEEKFCRFYYTKKNMKFKILIILASIAWELFLVVDVLADYPSRLFFILTIAVRCSAIPVQLIAFILLFLKRCANNSFFFDSVFVFYTTWHTCATAILSSLDLYDTFPAGTSLIILLAMISGIRCFILPVIIICTLVTYTTAFLIVNPTFRVFAWLLVLLIGFSIGFSLSVTVENKFRELFIIRTRQEMTQEKIKERNSIQNSILQNVLPANLVEKIMEGSSKFHVERCEEISVVLSDFCNFTKMSANMTARQLITRLNSYFTMFDRLCKDHSLEKVKTIGDGYLACDYHGTGGQNTITFGLNIVTAARLCSRVLFNNSTKKASSESKTTTTTTSGEEEKMGSIRVGICKREGFVVVMGQSMLNFDVLGQIVRDVEKLEATCRPNCVQVSCNMEYGEVFEYEKASESGGLIVTGVKRGGVLKKTREGFIVQHHHPKLLSDEEEEEEREPVENENAGEKGERTLSHRSGSIVEERKQQQKQRYEMNWVLSCFKKKRDNMELLKVLAGNQKREIRIFNVVNFCVFFALFEIFVILSPEQLYSLNTGIVILAACVLASFTLAIASFFVADYFIHMGISMLNSIALSSIVALSIFFMEDEFKQRFLPERLLVNYIAFIQFYFVNIPFIIKFICVIGFYIWFITSSFIFINVHVYNLAFVLTSLLLFSTVYFIINNLIVYSVRESKRTEIKWKNLLSISERNKHLLRSFLPNFIIDRIVQKLQNEVFDNFDCSVLFFKISNFTIPDNLSYLDFALGLNDIFIKLDSLCSASGCMKIKSIHHVYIVASVSSDAQATMKTQDEEDEETMKTQDEEDEEEKKKALECKKRIAELALMYARLNTKQVLEKRTQTKLDDVHVNIGLNYGKVIGGIVGVQKYLFDIFGDSVNVAARMMSTECPPDQIQTSSRFKKGLESEFVFKERGEIQVKGKGSMSAFLLVGRTIDNNIYAPKTEKAH